MKKKGILLLTLLLVLSAFIAVAGCGGSNKNQTEKTETFNCGTQIVVTKYFGDGDNLLNAEMFDASNEKISIGSGSVRFDKVGNYKLILKSGTTYIFNIVDTEGPVAVLKEQSTIVYKGDTVKLDITFVDNANSEVSDSSVEIYFGESKVSLDENKAFVAENAGVYKVFVKAKDAAGNENTTVIEIESVETVYGKGLYIIPEQDDADILVYREKYTEGENAGKYRTVIRKDFNKTGFGYMTIKATKEAGLKPNTYYGLSFTVNSDSDSWAYYNPDNEWLTKKTVPTINYTIKTDENGEYYKRWWTFSSKSSYFDFSALTFREYVYGTGIDVVATPNQLSGTDITFIEELAADGSGRYVKGIKKAEDKNGFAPLTVSATKDAGLLPNKEYTVVISAELDGAGKTPGAAYYAVDNSWWLPGNDRIEITITTDENGEFSKTCNCYFADGTYVKFTGVKIIGGYAYDKGVTFKIKTGTTGMHIYDELKDETSDLYIKYIQRESGGGDFVPFTVSASTAAGLKPNTNYLVAVQLENDSGWLGYFVEQRFYGTDWVACVTTDNSGKLEYTFNAYLPKATNLVKFKSVTITESAYAKGLSIIPFSLTSNIKNNIYSDTANNGLGNIIMTKDSTTEVNGGTLVVSATTAAGLKANTAYTVVMNMSVDRTDGNESALAYYDRNTYNNASQWQAKPNSPKCSFTVITNDKGEFTQKYTTYWGKNCTYVRFDSIELKGSAYAAGVSLDFANVGSSLELVDDLYDSESNLYIKRLNKIGNEGGNPLSSKLTIKASSVAGLKANTTYTVTVTAEFDGTGNAVYYHTDNDWLLGDTNNKITTTVTTDENGEFTSKTWQTYFGNGTYVKFTGITITEVIAAE